MPTLGAGELLIIAAVVLVLFGSKKLPDAARAMGRSMRIFKAETAGLHDDQDDGAERQQRPATSQLPSSGGHDQTSETARASKRGVDS